MNLEKFMIAVLVGAVLFIWGMFATLDVVDNYSLNSTVDSDFQPIYNNLTKIYAIEEGMRNSSDSPIDADQTRDGLALTSIKTARKVWGTFDLVGDVINAVAKKLHVPSFFVTFALLGLSFGLIFGFIYLITGLSK